VVRINADGSRLVFGTFAGGSLADIGWGIAVDSAGNAYVTGQTSSPDFPTTVGAFDTAFGETSCRWGTHTVPCRRAFVLKMAADGTFLIYSTFLGGSGLDAGNGIAVDGNGSAYVTGETWSSDFPTTLGAFDTVHDGYEPDAFVTKFSPDGSTLAYSTYLGGDGWDYGYGVAVDGHGHAYVIGSTESYDFPTTPGALDSSRNGYESDAFVVKLNLTGSGLAYSTFFGGTRAEGSHSLTEAAAFGIAVDSGGAAHVVGTTWSPDFPTTEGALSPDHCGGADAFVAKLTMRAWEPLRRLHFPHVVRSNAWE